MKVKIEFEVELPNILHTKNRLDEYLRFYFRDNGLITSGNPFEEAGLDEPEPIFGTFKVEYVECDEELKNGESCKY